MKDDITVLIPISPIPSHPDTEILDTTVASIRERLPDSEIIFMFDGLPADKMGFKTDYEEFKKRYLWKINNELGNATPLVFENWSHQSLMVKKALEIVRTPFILFSEQDTPLHNDIPFAALLEPLRAGYANVIRFHFEAQIHPEHKYLMLDEQPIGVLGVPLIRTKQWSQRPHLARTGYYREISNKYWDDQPRFIEHIMYGQIAELDDWDEHRLHMYGPSGTLVRSKHLDGRRHGAEHYDPTAS